MTEEERQKRIKILKLKRKKILLEQEQLKIQSGPISGLESAWRGGAQNLTAGYIDEGAAKIESLLPWGRTYEEAVKDYRERYNRAREAHPGIYDAADIGTGVVTSLMGGGAAMVGKGAVAALKHLGKETAKSTVSAGVEGYGRSEADSLGGQINDTLEAAQFGAGAPAAFKAGGKVLRLGSGVSKSLGRGALNLAETLTPQGKGPIAAASREVAVKGAKMGGVTPETAETYRELLKSRRRLKDALTAEDSYRQESEGLQKTVKDFTKNAKTAVSKKYVNLQRKATQELKEDVNQVVEDGTQVLRDAFEQAADKQYYKPETRTIIKQSYGFLTGKNPIMRKNLKKGMTPDVALSESLISARRHLDKNTQYMKDVGFDLDARLLREARDDLDEIFKRYPALKEADEFWTTYKASARPMLDSFTGRNKNSKRMNTAKIDQWIRDSVGASSLERDALRRDFRAFLKKYDDMDITEADLNRFEGNFQKYRDAQDVRNLVSEAGGRTGKSLMSSVGAGAAVGGPVGAAIAAIIKPVNNPAGYLKNVQTVRDWVSKTPDAEVRAHLGSAYDKVISAIRGATVTGYIKSDDKEMNMPAMNVYGRPQQ